MTPNPSPPLPGPTVSRPQLATPVQITSEEVHAWVARRERFRKWLVRGVVLVLAIGVGAVATFWTFFNEQLVAMATLRSNNLAVDWDLTPVTIWHGGESQVRANSARYPSFLATRVPNVLVPLKSLLHLKSLDLGGVYGLEDKDLDVLASLSELEHLQLFRTRDYEGKRLEPFCDASAEHIKGLKKLRTLVLTDNNITDAGVAKLVNLDALESLDLDGTDITDASLEFIKKMKSLRYVTVRNTGVTPAAAAKFRSQMTSIEITDQDIPPGPPGQ